MELWNKILWYLNPRRKSDPDAPNSLNVRFMHGINKISLVMFLFAVIFMVVRAIVRG